MKLLSRSIIFIILTLFLITGSQVTAEERAFPGTIPSQIVDLIAQGRLNAAVLAMRESPATPKLDHLMRQATRIALFEIQKKPDRSKAHSTYQNVAIAYHNLYLFLRAQGIDQESYAEEALRLYKKARSTGTLLHRAECDVLRAALFASQGDLSKAEKLFGKIKPNMMRGDVESMEYLAVYYAALGDVDQTVKALSDAYQLDPKRTLAYLEVSDDFYRVRQDPRFSTMRASWNAQEEKKEEEITLRIPRSKKPQFDMTKKAPQDAGPSH